MFAQRHMCLRCLYMRTLSTLWSLKALEDEGLYLRIWIGIHASVTMGYSMVSCLNVWHPLPHCSVPPRTLCVQSKFKTMLILLFRLVSNVMRCMTILCLLIIDSQKWVRVLTASSSIWSYPHDSYVPITASNMSMWHKQIYVYIDMSQKVVSSFAMNPFEGVLLLAACYQFNMKAPKRR